MRARPAFVAEVGLGMLLLAASSTASAETLQVNKLRTSPFWVYNCAHTTDKRQYDVKTFGGRWEASVEKAPEGFLEVTQKDPALPFARNCVRIYAVELENNQKLPVKGECGPKEQSPKTASTRNVGEGCK